MWQAYKLFLVIIAGISGCLCRSIGGDRVIVVHDKWNDADLSTSEYSGLFDSMSARGFELNHTDVKSAELFADGEINYSHLILLPSKTTSPGLSAKNIVKFAQDGGNILFLTSGDALTETTRETLKQFNIQLSERGSVLVDHFHRYSRDTDESENQRSYDIMLGKENLVPNPIVPTVYKGIVYNGLSFTLGAKNSLLIPILRAYKTSYTFDTKEEFDYSEHPWAVGSQAFLIASMQALNNARITVVGSAQLASNKYFKESSLGNENIMENLVKWTFQEKNVIKAVELTHYLATDPSAKNPDTYKVKTDAVFNLELSEYYDDEWHPFITNDIQLEFKMLDPYIRTTLTLNHTSSTSAIYSKTFLLPDHYGVFTFKVDYERSGISFIDIEETVTVRHLSHDEYPRFLQQAYPYYSITAAVMIGWLAFVFVWLLDGQKKSNDDTKKKN